MRCFNRRIATEHIAPETLFRAFLFFVFLIEIAHKEETSGAITVFNRKAHAVNGKRHTTPGAFKVFLNVNARCHPFGILFELAHGVFRLVARQLFNFGFVLCRTLFHRFRIKFLIDALSQAREHFSFHFGIGRTGLPNRGIVIAGNVLNHFNHGAVRHENIRAAVG